MPAPSCEHPQPGRTGDFEDVGSAFEGGVGRDEAFECGPARLLGSVGANQRERTTPKTGAAKACTQHPIGRVPDLLEFDQFRRTRLEICDRTLTGLAIFIAANTYTVLALERASAQPFDAAWWSVWFPAAVVWLAFLIIGASQKFFKRSR